MEVVMSSPSGSNGLVKQLCYTESKYEYSNSRDFKLVNSKRLRMTLTELELEKEKINCSQ